MFNKIKFAHILKKVSETYENQREFAEKSKVNRTYLSQYINLKLDTPPTPKILEKIAESSNKITNYNDLMFICGYIGFPTSAIYDFSTDNDKTIIDTILFYIFENDIDLNSIETDKTILNLIKGLEELSAKQVFKVVIDTVEKNSNIYNRQFEKESTKIDDLYMHLAKEAQNLNLDQEDVNYIINLYKKYKK